jgi:hypothetical protein
MEPQDNTGKHLLAIGLVALIGLTGMVLMFKEVGSTGQVTQVSVRNNKMQTCNDNEVLLSQRGVAALRDKGRARYGAGFSPYTAAHINYNGVGYCANGEVVRDILG